jgi:hypothetical protein
MAHSTVGMALLLRSARSAESTLWCGSGWNVGFVRLIFFCFWEGGAGYRLMHRAECKVYSPIGKKRACKGEREKEEDRAKRARGRELTLSKWWWWCLPHTNDTHVLTKRDRFSFLSHIRSYHYFHAKKLGDEDGHRPLLRMSKNGKDATLTRP